MCGCVVDTYVHTAKNLCDCILTDGHCNDAGTIGFSVCMSCMPVYAFMCVCVLM